jgi:hypothetical protein
VPPRGWDTRPAEPPAGVPDLKAMLALIDAVREAVPAELSRQVAEALRELLLALRALIDWYLERLDAPPPERGQVDVEDIPLD